MPDLDTSSSTNAGRGRPPGAGAGKRVPLPGWLPRAAKRVRGRGDARTLPAHVRVFGVQLRPEDRGYIRRKLGMKLGKFASSIERISVRVEDVNGPRGGIDRACRIKVVLSALPSVVVVTQDHSAQAAIDLALDRTERAVRRTLARRRMKPLKGRRRRPAAPA